MFEDNKLIAKKTGIIFFGFSIFCIVFAAIYEIFSHQVYSAYMIGAFLYPLLGGSIPMAIFYKMKGAFFPNILARYGYYSGIATLTVGSIFQGVLEIYGTTNTLSAIYWYVGIGLVAFGIIAWAICLSKNISKNRKK